MKGKHFEFGQCLEMGCAKILSKKDTNHRYEEHQPQPCNCDICENHEYSGQKRMNIMEMLYYLQGRVEMLDNRRGMMTLYTYCPWCGKKINWKEIKKLVKPIIIK